MAAEPPEINLRDVGLFQDLSPAELQALKAYLKEKSFSKGEVLSFEGTECERIFVVQSGRVKIFRASPGGKEQILEILGPGDTCACNPGEARWQCSSSAQALTACRVWFLPRDQYVRLFRTNHKLTRKISQIFAKRLCCFSALIEEISLDEPERRLAKFILDMTQALSAAPGVSSPESINFTHEEIAQRLGLARETVTRHLNKLKRLELIEVKHQSIRILKIKELEKIAF